MSTTALNVADILPLTCTREGTCCHGKTVWLNPWELASLAHGRQLSAHDFRAAHVEHGIRLRFNGPPGSTNSTAKLGPACSQYADGVGCLSHPGRPLACRLYPLGREKSGSTVRYVYEGNKFPCLSGCPKVTDLPRISVADYLAGQLVGPGELAQDTYLEMAQDLAEGAFVVLFDSGLAATRGPEVLTHWRKVIAMDPAARIEVIGDEWFDRLTVPDLGDDVTDPTSWISEHRAQFQIAAQEAFGRLRDADTLAEASVRFFALALHLVQAVGAANPTDVGRRWLEAAQTKSLSPLVS